MQQSELQQMLEARGYKFGTSVEFGESVHDTTRVHHWTLSLYIGGQFETVGAYGLPSLDDAVTNAAMHALRVGDEFVRKFADTCLDQGFRGQEEEELDVSGADLTPAIDVLWIDLQNARPDLYLAARAAHLLTYVLDDSNDDEGDDETS